MALNMDRREFLTAAGASALASVIPTKASAIPGPLADPGHLRVAVLDEPGFPTVDAPAPDFAVLGAALEGLDVAYLAAGELADRLSPDRFDVFVMPYGSAFPKEAWPAIHGYLQGAGNWVVVGGTPCAVPVERTSASGWQALPREITYHKQLGINLACAMSAASVSEWRANEALPWAAALAQGVAAGTVWEPYWRLSSVSDAPEESGSSGTHEADVVPLVSGLDAAGRPLVAPLVLVDRLEREYAGGRWVLATGDGALPPATLRALVEAAARGARQLRVRPSFACYRDGERPSVSVAFHGFPRAAAAPLAATCRIRVFGARDTALATVDVAVNGTDAEASGSAELGPAFPDPLAPGLYRLEAALTAPGEHPLELRSTTGFWVWDEQLLGSGTPLVPGPFGFARQGRPYPVTGTTYMASDVHRKFLFEPNPHVWDRDFASMKGQGINMVRTGLWTAWTRVMLDPGAVDEDVLSALDAYVLSAAKNGIFVCFNFFAFLPPAYGDSNPYLGPRALEGQRALLTMVARRYRGVGWIHWDLINEPSYAPPQGVWSNLPIGDEHEARAWREWAEAKHGTDPLVLRDLWRDASDDLLGVPAAREVGYSFLREGRRPRKVRDFFEFTQVAAARWAATLRDVLKAAAGDTLVTLGQDEGGTGTRPAQLLHADSVDYTAVHTWWGNDDLLWDGFMTKVAGKPNMHQETGLMSLHDPDGAPWRTPAAAADLLDRKLGYAFAGRGAGVIQWAWNINPYMPIDNEATIGVNRPDGTAKLERDALGYFASFFATAATFLDDFAPEPVALVIPYARLFSGRPGGIDATKRIVRLLAERHGVVPQAFPDIRLTADQLRGVKLAIVPTPEILDEEAAKALLDASHAGTKVLVTGHVEGDSYRRATPSLQALGVLGEGRPVALHEQTPWAAPAGKPGWVTFENLAQHWLRRATTASSSTLKGGVWHEPLPLDFAREAEPLDALLAAALHSAGVGTHPAPDGVAARVLVAPKAILVACVNETPSAARRRVIVEGKPVEIPVEALRSRLALFERGTGRVIAATPGAAIGR